MKLIKKIAVAGAIALLPLMAMAQQKIFEPTKADDSPLQQLFLILNRLTNWLLTALIVLAGIFVVFAAYNYLTSGGDPEKVGKAKDTLIYAAVAVAIGLLSKIVVAIAQALVKVG